MKRTEIRYYFLLHLLMLMLSFGGVVSKTASGLPFLSLKWILLYGVLLLILGLYAIFWQQLLRHIMLSRAYACKSVTIVWGMIWGVLFFHELLTVKHIIAGVLVIAGVVLIASGKETHDTAD